MTSRTGLFSCAMLVALCTGCPIRNPHRWSTIGAVIHGRLALEDIRKVFNENIGKIENCYGSSKDKGEAVLHFVINPDGKVISAEMKSATPDVHVKPENMLSTKAALENVARCTAGVIQNLVFPKPQTAFNVDVEYPFKFDPAPPPPLPPPAPPTMPTAPKLPKAPKLPGLGG